MTGFILNYKKCFWPKNTHYFPHLQDWISLLPMLPLDFFHHLKIPSSNLLHFFLFPLFSSLISFSHSPFYPQNLKFHPRGTAVMQIDSPHSHPLHSAILTFSGPVNADRWSWCRSQCVQVRPGSRMLLSHSTTAQHTSKQTGN
jgi:hypothetical protein